MKQPPTAVLAFSGGLDTSWCAVWLRQERGFRVVTATVDTGGFTPAQVRAIAARSRECGAAKHYTIDGRRQVYDDFVGWIIRGNVLRGEVYPLCVAAERLVQAREAVRVARIEKAVAVCHGSTGAGNDQVRFATALAVLAPDLENLAPVRDLQLSREREAELLRAEGIGVQAKARTYSINDSLWGTTIGGGATHDSFAAPPEEAYTFTTAPERAPAAGREVTIGFERGLPVSLDGRRMSGIDVVLALNRLGSEHGFGRGIHLGDTILGIKGRIAFEAPAPLMLIRAHRELEKLVLTKWQQYWKRQAGEFYGQLLHEGLWLDPAARDLEALIGSSQHRVTGEARGRLRRGEFEVLGVRSPYTLMRPEVARYGEGAAAWTGRDAAGFTKIYA
ncbi:MAG: argininosuccinate synthase, partial [Planctomycetes bacterium]|nr:argininosuccinate synthase [Planctomycetota bacterium]